jgi:hypothetical protein
MRMVATQIIERAAKSLRSFSAKNESCDFVDMRNHPFGIDQDNAVVKTLDDRFGFPLLVNQTVGHCVELRGHGLKFGQWLLSKPQ